MGPVTTLNLQGKYVLTSRVYANVQAAVNSDISSFIRSVSNAYNKYLNNANPNFTKFDAVVGIDTGGTGPNGGYASGTLLAKLDSQLAQQEFRLPYGAGFGSVTGGVGLSIKTAATTTNPASAAVDYESVAQLMEDGLSSATTPQEALTAMNTVRTTDTLAIYTQFGPGILPGYVEAFGPGGGVARNFGLRNSSR